MPQTFAKAVSASDQWWLCLDGVTEEIPVTVAEIERLIKTGDYTLAQALPATQAEMANPVWFDVTMPAALTPLPTITAASAGSFDVGSIGHTGDTSCWRLYERTEFWLCRIGDFWSRLLIRIVWKSS